MACSYFLEDSLTAKITSQVESFFRWKKRCWIPGWQLWPILVYRCHPRWTRRFSMWRLWTVRWLSLYSRLQTTTLGGYCWQTRSHPVKSKQAKLDAIFPLLRSHVGCHRVELREFDDVPFVFCSLFVVVQNSKAQTLVVESSNCTILQD